MIRFKAKELNGLQTALRNAWLAELPPFLFWLGALAAAPSAAPLFFYAAGLGIMIQAVFVWNLAHRLHMLPAPVLGVAALIPGVNAGVIVLLTLRVSRVRKSFGIARRRLEDLAPEEEREIDLSLSRLEIATLCFLFLFLCANYAFSAVQQLRGEGLRAFEQGDYQTAGAKLKWLFFCDDPAVRARRAFCALNDASESAEATSAVEELRSLGDNDPVAAWGLGFAYLIGLGVPQDETLALQYLGKAAELDFLPAQIYLGKLLKSGKRVPRDPQRAVALFRRASELGSGEAALKLGMCYDSGDGVPADPVRAAEYYRIAAERQAPEAGGAWAQCLFTGKGVKQNVPEAMRLLEQAADKNDGIALHLLGLIYTEGRNGIPPNRARGIRYLRRAAATDLAIAKFNLALKLIGEPETMQEALVLLHRAAEQDRMPEAANQLGIIYESGNYVERDFAEAERFYRSAVEAGFPVAASNLGLMLLDIPGREAEGVDWLKKAAEQKYPAAWNYLGLCYENGKGIAKDVLEAVRCYGKAIFLGNQDAVFNMAGLLDSKLSGHEPELAALFRRASEAGNPAAMAVFSAICWKGRGVTKDPDLALQWARKAAEARHPGGYYLLGRFYEEGGGSLKPDRAEAAKWFRKAKESGIEDLDRKILEMDAPAPPASPDSPPESGK